MTNVCSIGLGIPEYELSQEDIKKLVGEIFEDLSPKQLARFLPVFDNTMIEKRHFAVDREWFKADHTFKEKNNLYHRYALRYSLSAIDDCLNNMDFLERAIPYEAVDMLIFISSTGIATPSLDTYLFNERPFREDTVRMPLWGLGCAGGAIGLSRAFEWLCAHPEKNALVVCCELCSLTFQRNDFRKSNLIGTALFGDGAAASLILGDKSPYQEYSRGTKPKIKQTSSMTKKHSNSVMGWNVTNEGLEVIFSKSIPSLVRSFWKRHTDRFIGDINRNEINSFIAHPGGRKVLEAMEEVLGEPKIKFQHSYNVLQRYGNMSSATVLFVLQNWLKHQAENEETGILSALGPGFSSELLLLEWKKE
ncbi:type III polyketide synthase [Virgibacillus kekensis]|uniref:Type III polyketide synthase n=1 Tax=Virgibacillus kekensis TaxID=202261 RepID=A0ABV9DG60_9BACI